MTSLAELMPSPGELFALADCGLFARPWRQGDSHIRFSGDIPRLGVSYHATADLPWTLYFPGFTQDEVELVHAVRLESVLMLYALFTVR